MRRLVIAAAVGAAVVGFAVPSLAQSATPAQSLPVGVTNNDGTVCVWVSEQVPHCVSTNPITDALPGQWQAGPVTVDVSTANNGVAVGTALGSQPLVGVQVGNGEVCVGFSLEVPFCAPTRSTTAGKPAASRPAAPRQALPVVIYHDSTRTAVGVGDVGVVIYSDGIICPVVSTQKWPCVQGPTMA